MRMYDIFNTLKSNDGNNNVLAGSYLNMKNNRIISCSAVPVVSIIDSYKAICVLSANILLYIISGSIRNVVIKPVPQNANRVEGINCPHDMDCFVRAEVV